MTVDLDPTLGMPGGAEHVEIASEDPMWSAHIFEV